MRVGRVKDQGVGRRVRPDPLNLSPGLHTDARRARQPEEVRLCLLREPRGRREVRQRNERQRVRRP